MTDQQTLPGLEPQYPHNTPAGRWMARRGWMWSNATKLWFFSPEGSLDPLEKMTHNDATRLYFETDYPPF